MAFFDIIDLKGKVVALVNHQLNLVIGQSFSVHGATTLVSIDRDGRFFNDINSIPEVLNFSSVVGIGNSLRYRRTTKEFEDFLGVNDGYKIT